MDKLTDRQKRFVAELLAGATQEQAAIKAGYSAKNAASQASRMLRDPKIIAARKAYAKEIYDGLGLSAEKLALELEEIKRRCMTAEPHLSYDADAKEWLPDGTWMFDANGAIKAIRQQAALMGIAVKVEVDAGEKLEDFLRSMNNGREF